jgi:hypothetical protein
MAFGPGKALVGLKCAIFSSGGYAVDMLLANPLPLPRLGLGHRKCYMYVAQPRHKCHVDFNHCAPSNSRALRRSSGSSLTIDRIKSRKSAFSETESCGFWQIRSRGNGGNVDGVKSLPKATVSSALYFLVNFLAFVIKEAIAVLRPCKQRFGHAAKHRFHLC